MPNSSAISDRDEAIAYQEVPVVNGGSGDLLYWRALDCRLTHTSAPLICLLRSPPRDIARELALLHTYNCPNDSARTKRTGFGYFCKSS